MVSYLTFLLILCIHNVLDNNTHLRGPPDTGLEWVIILYVTSFIWMHIKICWKQGLRRYIYQNWHRYDLVLLGLFGASFAMWLWSWADVHMYGHKHIPRQYWSQYDPILIAEALYAIATIAAFGKTLYFFQISYELGPLQVSTSKLFKDIFYFFVSYLIALLAFGTGIHKLYNYYRGQVRHDNGEEIKQSGAFITFQATVKNLFWALFGYSPPQWADIVVSEHIYVYNNQTIVLTNKHKFTEAVGYILYGSYSVVTIIILLNLFIALVSTSFMIAKENADEEWKFSRTKVWMVFFEQGSTLPPPFNLVPTVKSVCYKVTWLYQKLTGKYSKFPFQNCCLVKEENISQFTREQYEIVMGHLVQRYMIYATQMQLSQNRLADSDLQYLLHGIPAPHMMAPLLQTSSSDQESEEHCQTVEGEDIEVDLRERCSTSFCEFQTPRASSYDILSPRPPTKGGYLTD